MLKSSNLKKPKTTPASVIENLDKAVLDDSAEPPVEIVSNEDNDRIIKTETVMKENLLGLICLVL